MRKLREIFLKAALIAAAVITGGILLFLIGIILKRGLPQLSWSSIVLGFSLIGIELGYILLYRYGWKVNTGSLLVNAAVSLLLIFLGMMVYREMLSPRQVIGVIFCLLGTFMISK